MKRCSSSFLFIVGCCDYSRKRPDVNYNRTNFTSKTQIRRFLSFFALKKHCTYGRVSIVFNQDADVISSGKQINDDFKYFESLRRRKNEAICSPEQNTR